MKSLACYKEIVDRNMDIKDASCEDSEKSRAREKASVFLELMSIIMNRKLVGIQMLKVILMRSQVKMRNVLLEAKGKAILIINGKDLG